MIATANRVTLLRIVLLPLPVYLVYQGPAGQWAAIALFILLGVTDYLDGYLARRYGSTEFGKFLDPISDKIFVAALFLPILKLGVLPLWPILLVFVREFAVTELRTVYNLTGASFRTSAMGKYKTNVQVFGAVMALMNALLAGTGAMPVIVAVAVFPFLVLVTVSFFRRRRMHPFALLVVCTFVPALVAFAKLSVAGANYFLALVILFFTLHSGAEYFLGGRRKFQEYIRMAPVRRVLLFLAGGVLVPGIYATLAARGIGPAWVPIVIVALEFLGGGLDNYLTMSREEFSYRWKAAKLAGEIVPGFLALAFYRPGRESLLYLALAVALLYTTFYVVRHRARFAAGSRPVTVTE